MGSDRELNLSPRGNDKKKKVVGVRASLRSTSYPLLWCAKVGRGAEILPCPCSKRWCGSSISFLHPWYQRGSGELFTWQQSCMSCYHTFVGKNWWGPEIPSQTFAIGSKSQHSTFVEMVSAGPMRSWTYTRTWPMCLQQRDCRLKKKRFSRTLSIRI